MERYGTRPSVRHGIRYGKGFDEAQSNLLKPYMDKRRCYEPYLIVDAEELDSYPVRVVGHVERDEHRRHYQKTSCQLEVRVAEAASLLAVSDLLDLEDFGARDRRTTAQTAETGSKKYFN